jgi:hypothetical protein
VAVHYGCKTAISAIFAVLQLTIEWFKMTETILKQSVRRMKK